MLIKFIFSLLVCGPMWLGMSWMFARARWAALPSFPGGRNRLFAATALTWFPWLACVVTGAVVQEAIDPDARLGMGATVGLAVVVALVVLALCLLATNLFPPTRRLYRDLREAGRNAKAAGEAR